MNTSRTPAARPLAASVATLLALSLALSLPAFAQDDASEPVAPDDDAIDTAATPDEDAAPPATPEAAVPIEEVRRFVSVFRAVEQAYVDDVADEKLMRAAIRGLLLDLDPHSAYLEEDQASALSEQAAGAYDGLGIEVIQQPDRSLVVVSPIDGTPAARAGIKPGDVIIEIDGQAITADSADGAVDSMRGPPGTPIELTLLREGRNEPITLTLIRETIRVQSVSVDSLEPRYGYARISTFQADTSQELEKKLEQVTKKSPLSGLVLDLRSNPGGLLTAAVEVSDLFLEEGVVVSTRGRIPAANAVYRAAPGDIIDGAPIVVLTDAGTASAAEVVAGALRDHRRAVVMGVDTFGKGSVQSVLPLDNGDAIKVTTARYYTPNGTSIQALGIEPDISLSQRYELADNDDGYTPPTIREADLPGHLRNEADAKVETREVPEQLDDYAVREALNLLKGLAVISRRDRQQEATEEGP